MRNKIYVVLLLASFTTFLPANANADTWVECVNCNNFAMSEEAERQGAGRHYVWDLDNGVIRRYQVDYDFETRQSFVFELPVPSTIRNEFDGVYEIIDGISQKNTFNYPFGTAYDYALGTADHRDLAVAYMVDLGFFGRAALATTSLAVSLVDKLANINLVINVNFPDGSTLKFKILGYDFTDHTITWVAFAGTDQNGNPINFDAAQYVGDQGYVEGSSALGILGHWNDLGVDVHGFEFLNMQNDLSCTYYCVRRGNGVECTLSCQPK